MTARTTRRTLVLMITALFCLALPAFSQSCALCYTQAASSGAKMIAALKSGILILIAPPTFMSIGVIFVLYRKRNQFRQLDYTPESDRVRIRGKWQLDN